MVNMFPSIDNKLDLKSAEDPSLDDNVDVNSTLCIVDASEICVTLEICVKFVASLILIINTFCRLSVHHNEITNLVPILSIS